MPTPNKNLTKNVVSWFHIPTSDFDRAVKFYSTILGNAINVMDFNGQTMGFFPMAGGPTSDGVGGALMPPMKDVKGMENLMWEPSKHGTQVFLSCEGVMDAVLGRVVAAGGKILTPRTAMGDSPKSGKADPGYFAWIEDTEGNKVGLHSRK